MRRRLPWAMQFSRGLAVFERGEKRRWRAMRAVEWHVGRKQSGLILRIPAGREFESSVPRWAKWIVHPDDARFLLAALVHDYMLEERTMGRAQAAAEWLDAAFAGGAPQWLAKLAYVAVAIWAVVK